MKRLIDIYLSLVCIILFSPLFIICYVAIKLEDGGSALFKQERIGKQGKPFNTTQTSSPGLLRSPKAATSRFGKREVVEAPSVRQ